MKSSEVNPKPSCCVIIKQRACFEHGQDCREPDYVLGWILDWKRFDVEAARKFFDSLERLGFNERLEKKV